MALIDDFKARFAEFPTATVDTYLPMLESVWPAYYNKPYQANTKEAVLNLVAHLLVAETEAAGAGGAGASVTVSSVSVGGVSTSYVIPQSLQNSASYSQFGTTRYGQRFWLLARNNYGGVAV